MAGLAMSWCARALAGRLTIQPKVGAGTSSPVAQLAQRVLFFSPVKPAPAPTWTHWRDKPAPDYVSNFASVIWRNASLAERAVHVARAQLDKGVQELSPNWSPDIRRYLAVTGIFRPAPWCAAFVTWCLIEAGADRKKLPALAASTYWWYVWAKQTKRLRVDTKGKPANAPRRGDLAGWNSGTGHIFIVREVVRRVDGGPKVGTIEGNTNRAGGREGVAVMERTRTWPELARHTRYGFIAITNDLGVGEGAE